LDDHNPEVSTMTAPINRKGRLATSKPREPTAVPEETRGTAEAALKPPSSLTLIHVQ